MAPRLTDKHFNLPPFMNMRVNLAAQVLSHSVAAGINTLCTFKKLDEESKYTAEFIENFDQLFNAFNSNTVRSAQKMGHAISESSAHEEFFKSILQYLDNISLAKSQKLLPCIRGWKITITAITQMWQQLQMHSQYSFLLTRRFNQDCIENLFSVIRGMGGNRDNPDVQQFQSSFRYVLINKLFSPSLGANCELDYDKLVLDLQVFLKKKSQTVSIPCTSTSRKSFSEHAIQTRENLTNDLEMTVDDVACQYLDANVLSSLYLTVESDISENNHHTANELNLGTANIVCYNSGYLLRKVFLQK